jgi:hypothetical protein
MPACGAAALSARGCGVASSWTATNAPSKTPTLAALDATTTGWFRTVSRSDANRLAEGISRLLVVFSAEP